jgi:hypothetical protein
LAAFGIAFGLGLNPRREHMMEDFCARCGEGFDDDLLIDLCERCDADRHRELREAKERAKLPAGPRPRKFKVKPPKAVSPTAASSQAAAAAACPESPDSVLYASELFDELSFPSHEPTPSPTLPSEANRQAAEEWATKAQQKHEQGDDAAALRFCERSLRLSDHAAARSLERHLKLFGEGTPPAAEAARVLAAGSHLAVLGLSRGEAGSTEAVKKAYKRLCLLLHPDRNHARQAEAAFKRLQSAYDALKSGSKEPAMSPNGRSSSGGSCGKGASVCAECGLRRAEPNGTFVEEDGLCWECHADVYGPDSGAAAEEAECEECGEPCESGDGWAQDICFDCQERLEAERAERRRAESRRAQYGGAGNSTGSRCAGCHQPYKPPPSYMGNRPMCFSCREDDLVHEDDDYMRYRYSGYGGYY